MRLGSACVKRVIACRLDDRSQSGTAVHDGRRKRMAKEYPQVELDEWVAMPNHLLLVLVIIGRRGGSGTAPTSDSTSRYDVLLIVRAGDIGRAVNFPIHRFR